MIMKMKKVTLLGLALGLMIFVSCSKNQKVVKRLAAGDWKITSISVDGVAQDPTAFVDITYTFDKCPVEKEECSGKFTAAAVGGALSISNRMDYRITDDGTKMTQIIQFEDGPDTSVYDIIENSKTKFVFAETDSSTIETTIELVE